MTPKNIVIAGAGFGGLRLARLLNNRPEFKVTLIDRNNYHQFQPLFYQVATANLDASNISFPLRNIFRNSKNVNVRVAEIIKIDPDTQTVLTDTGLIPYDTLVLAMGADTNYYQNEEIMRNAYPMKSTVEALQLRNRIIQNFEEASITKDVVLKKQLLTVVIVGGGPTGIELAGALAEMELEKIPKEYPELAGQKLHIYLLEGAPRLLGGMRSQSAEVSLKYLEQMGVKVLLNTLVKNYDGHEVELVNGETINSKIVIWAAGVRGNVPEGLPVISVHKSNRLNVNSNNLVSGTSNIYAIGDLALFTSDAYPNGLPQVANVAIDQASNLAKNLVAQLNNAPLLPYKYRNKGAMATVGRNKAVVDLQIPKLSFKGFFAWFIWMALHLFLLIGLKNRLVVFINWVVKYFTRNQSLSLLFSPLSRKSNQNINIEQKPE